MTHFEEWIKFGATATGILIIAIIAIIAIIFIIGNCIAIGKTLKLKKFLTNNQEKFFESITYYPVADVCFCFCYFGIGGFHYCLKTKTQLHKRKIVDLNTNKNGNGKRVVMY